MINLKFPALCAGVIKSPRSNPPGAFGEMVHLAVLTHHSHFSDDGGGQQDQQGNKRLFHFIWYSLRVSRLCSPAGVLPRAMEWHPLTGLRARYIAFRSQNGCDVLITECLFQTNGALAVVFAFFLL